MLSKFRLITHPILIAAGAIEFVWQFYIREWWLSTKWPVPRQIMDIGRGGVIERGVFEPGGILHDKMYKDGNWTPKQAPPVSPPERAEYYLDQNSDTYKSLVERQNKLIEQQNAQQTNPPKNNSSNRRTYPAPHFSSYLYTSLLDDPCRSSYDAPSSTYPGFRCTDTPSWDDGGIGRLQSIRPERFAPFRNEEKTLESD